MSKDRNSEWKLIKKLLTDQADEINNNEQIRRDGFVGTVKSMCLTQKDIRQRIDGSIKYIDYLSKKYREYSREDIAVTVSFLEGGNVYHPDLVVDFEYCPLGGMAIWILDVLKKHGKLEEVCEIVNSLDYDKLNELEIPPLLVKGHYLYNNLIIENLYYILFAERQDFSGKSCLGEYWLKIREFIPDDEINTIFEKAYSLIDLYVKCSIDCSIFYKQKMESPNNYSFTSNFDNSLLDLDVQYSQLHMGMSFNLTTYAFRKLIGNDFYKRMEAYYTEIYRKEIDLYGMCAAYCLLKSRNDCYSLMLTLPQISFRTIFLLLPWHTKMLTKNMDDVKIDYSILDVVDMSSYYAVYFPIYRHYYPEDGAEYMANFAQYFFLKNEAILPYEDLPNSINDFTHFDDKLAEKLCYYDRFISLNNYSKGLNLIGIDSTEEPEISYIEDESEEIEVESVETNDSEDLGVEDLKNENKALRDEIETLHKTIYSQGKNLRVLERKYEYLRNDYDRCHNLMAELNEAIFNRDNANEELVIDEEKFESELPYETKKRCVVFGGHATWLKAIKPMLRNVNFVSDGVQFPIELVRNADMIWIQTNAISHSEYYKIIDAVRLYNKSCHYFKYSSALKCAKQFIETEKSSKGIRS